MATSKQIQSLVKRIERTVDEHSGAKMAEQAVKAFILAVPLKKKASPSKKDLLEGVVRSRGARSAEELAHAKDVVQSGYAGAFVRADDATRYGVFEGDLIIIIPDGRGTENVDEVLTLRADDIVFSQAEAVDGNMEHFNVKDAADAIIETYAFGAERRGRGPWYPLPGRTRY